MTMPVSQNKRRALYRNASVGLFGALVAIVVAGRVFELQLHGPAALVLAAILAVSILQFAALDEVAKQAHYVAWYWGGMAAICVGAVGAVALYAMPQFVAAAVDAWLAATFADTSPRAMFLAGAVTPLVLMVAGFAAWWAVYWLRRR